MTAETTLVFNINAGAFILGLSALFIALLGIVWRARNEIVQTIREEIRRELAPMEERVSHLEAGFARVEEIIGKLIYAIIEIQTILREKFAHLTIAHGLHNARDDRSQ